MSSGLLTLPVTPVSERREPGHVLIGRGGRSLYVVSRVWCIGSGPSTDASMQWYFDEEMARATYAQHVLGAVLPAFFRLVEVEVDAETYELAQQGSEDAFDAIQYALEVRSAEIEAGWSPLCEESAGPCDAPAAVWAVVGEACVLGRRSRTSTVWVQDPAAASALFEAERSASVGVDVQLRLVEVPLPPHVARYLPLAAADATRFGTPVADTWAGEQITEWVEAAVHRSPAARVCRLSLV